MEGNDDASKKVTKLVGFKEVNSKILCPKNKHMKKNNNYISWVCSKFCFNKRCSCVFCIRGNGIFSSQVPALN